MSIRKRVKNIWPFDSFKSSTVYHVKPRKTGSRISGNVTKYKGYQIYKSPEGLYTVPELTGNDGSWFEDLRQAKRYINSTVKDMRQSNPKNLTINIKNPADWFARCVEGVKSKGSGYDPNAVCASVMRRKRGY